MRKMQQSQLELLYVLLRSRSTVTEIADQLDKSERTIEARLERLMDRDAPLVAYNYPPMGRAVYRLTQQGDEVLKDQG